MEQFKFHREGEDKCRYDLGWKKSCADCLFDTLCLFDSNQEKNRKNSNKSKKDSQGNDCDFS